MLQLSCSSSNLRHARQRKGKRMRSGTIFTHPASPCTPSHFGYSWNGPWIDSGPVTYDPVVTPYSTRLRESAKLYRCGTLPHMQHAQRTRSASKSKKNDLQNAFIVTLTEQNKNRTGTKPEQNQNNIKRESRRDQHGTGTKPEQTESVQQEAQNY